MSFQLLRAWPIWAAAALLAVPIAYGSSVAGFGIVIGNPAVDVVRLVVLSIAEEVVFRGALLPALSRMRLGWSCRWLTPANVLSSALFAMLHLWNHPPIVAALIFPVSLVYGRAREVTGRVWPAAALHVYFNGLLYAISWLRA